MARLNELGLPVQSSAVAARAQGAVGRPHLAEELVAMGAVDSVQEAFDVYIGNGKPGHVEQERPTVAEAATILWTQIMLPAAPPTAWRATIVTVETPILRATPNWK